MLLCGRGRGRGRVRLVRPRLLADRAPRRWHAGTRLLLRRLWVLKDATEFTRLLGLPGAWSAARRKAQVAARGSARPEGVGACRRDDPRSSIDIRVDSSGVSCIIRRVRTPDLEAVRGGCRVVAAIKGWIQDAPVCSGRSGALRWALKWILPRPPHNGLF